jgi:pimeloyl-ACP methyl ester carboxylesterase
MLIDGPDCLLHVEVLGAGAPVTVFAHGITSSVEEIRYLAARTPGTRVLFDFRGHGHSESPAPEAGYGQAAMRRDLEQIANRFGATRAVGVSMGASAILSILEDDPSRFERIVLLIPARLDEPNETTPTYSALADALETQSIEAVAEASAQAPEYAELFAARPKWRNLVRRRILRMNAHGIPHALRAYAAEGGPVGDVERLRKVEAPVLILAHAGEGVHDIEVARRIAELLPDARLRAWDEPLAMFDEPAALAALIGDFLDAAVP